MNLKPYNDDLDFIIFNKQIEDKVEYLNILESSFTNKQIINKAYNFL